MTDRTNRTGSGRVWSSSGCWRCPERVSAPAALPLHASSAWPRVASTLKQMSELLRWRHRLDRVGRDSGRGLQRKRRVRKALLAHRRGYGAQLPGRNR